MSGGTITLGGTALPQITASMSIVGPGENSLAISGANTSQVFNIAAGPTAQISGLTIEDGNGGSTGGGVYNAGTLVLAEVALVGNTSSLLGGAIYAAPGSTTTINDSVISGNTSVWGGGIYEVFGTLTLNGSTVAHNSVTGEAIGGGIFDYGTATISDSTVYDNSALGNAGAGGGIAVYGSATVIDSTVTDNTADFAGGIEYAPEAPATDFLNLQNTIVSGNTTQGQVPNLYGNVTDNGYNLLGAELQGHLSGTGDVFSANPLLGPLTDNGGPTQTMTPLVGSPAIDAGDPSQVNTADQRGVNRPSGGVDIGAVQATQNYFLVSNSSDTGAGSLRQAITDSNNTTPLAGGPNVIQFDSSLSGATITLGGTELPQITKNVTITGLGASSLAISGNSTSRVFDIANGATVDISGLTIENGNLGTSGNGAGVTNAGNLTISASTISGNTGKNGGGLYNSATGTVTLNNVSVVNNVDGGVSPPKGGGIDNLGTMTLTNSIVSGNTSNGMGGGIANAGKLYVIDTTISGNSVTGASPNGVGGGIFDVGTVLSVTGSTISTNSATVSGGGVFSESGTVAILDSTVSGNNANLGGGIYMAMHPAA